MPGAWGRWYCFRAVSVYNSSRLTLPFPPRQLLPRCYLYNYSNKSFIQEYTRCANAVLSCVNNYCLCKIVTF
ncbi:CRISPR-associated protein Cas5 [Pontibacter amylolyticus]|uniref:CRISPR-associated protein Cas5 n=1 Tax=Pontibacter amylolyticus TaxID=1424080 RepID=UPI00166313AD